MNSNSSIFSPLSPHEFHILVTIAHRSLNAYSIRHQVEKDAGGSVTLSGSTAQRALKRLLRCGLIIIEEEEPHRRYQTTNIGRQRLEQDIKRQERAIMVGKMALNDGRYITGTDLLTKRP